MISRKIMVIDDDVRVINSIRMVMPELEIVDFCNGEEGLEYLKKPNNILLVLLDVMMPGIDGMTVLHEIKKVKPQIPVIMMTAYGSMDVVVQALRNKADDFLEKPFDINMLRERIRERLRRVLESREMKDNPSGKVDRIKRFIQRNYSNVSLESIAREMGLSTRYVSRMFNDVHGAHFRDYCLKIKMKMAIEMLTKTSHTIEYISEKVGYINPESFMRIFKKRYHLTPSEYREKYHEQNTEKKSIQNV